jgi:hypothetical protein
MHLYTSLSAWKELGRVRQKTQEVQRAWQDSNLRHTAPETVAARLRVTGKPLSMRFLRYDFCTISQR